MHTFTQASKYVPETVSIVLSFADLLESGEQISGIPVVVVTTESGIDPNPNNLLYQGCTVSNGNTIEQRFRLGLSGVIYTLNFTIQTTLGNTLEKDCNLAILPSDGTAIPNWLTLLETTQLYPIQLSQDFYKTPAPQFIAGQLIQVILNYSLAEQYQTPSPSFISGILHETVISYNNDYDSYKNPAPSFVSGSLVIVSINYNYDYDSYKTPAPSFLSGTLTVVSINYNNAYDSYKTPTPTFVSGTLA